MAGMQSGCSFAYARKIPRYKWPPVALAESNQEETREKEEKEEKEEQEEEKEEKERGKA